MTERMQNRNLLCRRASGRRRTGAWRRLVLLLWSCLPRAPARARVFDEFQVYDGRIGEPGGFDYDQHIVFGRRGRIAARARRGTACW